MRMIDADLLKELLCKKDEDYDKPIISPKFLNGYIDDFAINSQPTYTSYTYDKGLKDVWKLLKAFQDMEVGKRQEIFGEYTIDKLLNMPIRTVLDKFETYERMNEIKVGDVVILRNLGKAVVLFIHYDSETADVMIDDGHILQYEVIKKLKKTGEHFDIEKMLEQLKGE